MWRILVTTDFSDASKKAFDMARRQAELEGRARSSLLLLSVLEDLAPTSVQFEFGLAVVDSKEILDQAEKEAEKKLKAIAEEFFPDLQVETKVIRAADAVYAEIINFAGANHIDLIIMATHGRTGAKRLMLGSVSERVIREAPCPVLVVPAQEYSS